MGDKAMSEQSIARTAPAQYRIIDRDVEFYQGEVETRRRQLRSCMPADEAKFVQLLQLAENIHVALVQYRDWLDHQE